MDLKYSKMFDFLNSITQAIHKHYNNLFYAISYYMPLKLSLQGLEKSNNR